MTVRKLDGDKKDKRLCGRNKGRCGNINRGCNADAKKAKADVEKCDHALAMWRPMRPRRRLTWRRKA